MNRRLRIYLILVVFALVTGNLYSENIGDQSATPPTDNESPKSNSLLKQQFVIPDQSFNVAIIESRSYNTGHVMDTVWAYVCNQLGFNNEIFPQTLLDDEQFFAETDILIIASGVADLSANRVNTIISFLRSGKPVYMQMEYLCNYTTNLAFQQIVDSLGGAFDMSGTVNGDLIPMQVLGGLGNSPNVIDALNYYWYGCAGSGDETIESFLSYNEQFFGHIFTPTDVEFGIMISTSDQDWIRVSTSLPLMENILARLINMSPASVEEISEVHSPVDPQLLQNYPNPFNPQTMIRFEIPRSATVTLDIFNELGQKVHTLVNGYLSAGKHERLFDARILPSGNYFYRLNAGKVELVKRMVLVK